MKKTIIIRLLDEDGIRLTEAEQKLEQALQRHGVTADVQPVACHLEISRQGFAGATPAMQVNGFTVISGMALTDAHIEDCCRRLADWQRADG